VPRIQDAGLKGLKTIPSQPPSPLAVSNIRKSGVAVVLAVAVAGAGLYFCLSLFFRPHRDNTVEVVVPRGASFSRALSLFREARALPSEFPFRILGRVVGLDRALKPGAYRVPPEARPLAVFRMLEKGEILTVTLTIPEGYSMAEIADVVESAGLGNSDEFLQLAADPELLDEARIHAPTFEGFLFPDTYSFPTVYGTRDVILAMASRFHEIISNRLGPRIAESGLSLLEVVTLASIVEKEARESFERPLIASVYLNRLSRNMRLEADPTILYGIRPLGEPIRRSEIRKRTPYNTYVIRGLPPGPIASPGLASIEAVLNPSDTDFLYFVANENGTHKFSETLEAHNEAVRKTRRNQR